MSIHKDSMLSVAITYVHYVARILRISIYCNRTYKVRNFKKYRIIWRIIGNIFEKFWKE